MFPQQQIIGVNERLGNVAVKDMQGTTRVVFDTIASNGPGVYRFFENVQARPAPLSNISSNRFEPGESLAIDCIILLGYAPAGGGPLPQFQIGRLNFYIGNQRVIKDQTLNIAKTGLGNINYIPGNSVPAVIRLETPIVIPPQIEFYADLQIDAAWQFAGANANMVLSLAGAGTLLNTQNNY